MFESYLKQSFRSMAISEDVSLLKHRINCRKWHRL